MDLVWLVPCHQLPCAQMYKHWALLKSGQVAGAVRAGGTVGIREMRRLVRAGHGHLHVEGCKQTCRGCAGGAPGEHPSGIVGGGDAKGGRMKEAGQGARGQVER